jgi:hypothetical protein
VQAATRRFAAGNCIKFTTGMQLQTPDLSSDRDSALAHIRTVWRVFANNMVVLEREFSRLRIGGQDARERGVVCESSCRRVVRNF